MKILRKTYDLGFYLNLFYSDIVKYDVYVDFFGMIYIGYMSHDICQWYMSAIPACARSAFFVGQCPPKEDL